MDSWLIIRPYIILSVHLCREVPAAVSATPAAAAMASLEDDVLELLIQDEQPGKPTADPKKLEVERFWGAWKKKQFESES